MTDTFLVACQRKPHVLQILVPEHSQTATLV
jgi:hypothetical protein